MIDNEELGVAPLPPAALAVLEASADGVLIVDGAASIAFASSTAGQLFGYTVEELVGQQVHQLVPTNAQKIHRSHTTRYISRPERRLMGEQAAELAGRRKDGSEFPVEISLSPFDHEGRQFIIASVRDISRRRRLEDDARAIQQSLDKVADATILFDAETIEILHVNEGAVAQSGYSREALLTGMSPTHFLPDLQPDFDELLGDIVSRQRDSIQVETTLRRRDGTDLIVDLSMQMPEAAILGGRRCVMAIAHDVTGRKAIETRIATSERFFRETFKNAPVPVFILDMADPSDRTFVEVNRATEKFLGYTEDELVGSSISEYLRPGFSPDSEGFIASAQEDTYQRELSFVTRDGTTAWGNLTARRIDVNDSPVRLVHLEDITRRVEAESERDRRETQLELLADIRRQVMSDEPLEVVLANICKAGCRVLDAAAVTIALPRNEDELDLVAVATADGRTPERRSVPIDDSFIGEVFRSWSRAHSSESSAIGVVGERVAEPMISADGRIEGVMVAAPMAAAQIFTPPDLDAIAAIATEAAVAVELDRARAERRSLMVIQDRERIARELHDVVIQRLFAAGMGLQAALGSDRLEARALQTIHELDDTIRSVRDSVFRLASSPKSSLEEELEAVVDRFRSDMVRVSLSVHGSTDWIAKSCAQHVGPVINELVANAIRHGDAKRIDIDLTIDRDERVTVRVEDDGSGLEDTPTSGGFGIGNLTERAYSLNGSFQLMPGAVEGAVAIWSAPLTAPKD